VIIGLIIFWVASSQSVNLLMNVVEFGNVFTKPLFYSIVSGLILCSIALVRVDYRHRNSITWYAIHLIVNFLKHANYDPSPYSSPSSYRSSYSSSTASSYSTAPSGHSKLLLRYPDFKMEKGSFILWQITKVVLFAPLFTNLIFGISAVYLLEGHDIGLGLLPHVFLLPFANPPFDGSFSEQHVIPLIPTLTLIIPSLLSVVGIRIFLYTGVAGGISIVSRYMVDSAESKPRLLLYISTIERILGVALLWTGFTMFFSFNINYNTKYAILGTFIMGAFFIAYGILDNQRSRVVVTTERRQIYARLLTVLIVTIVTGSLMAINNTIADAKKIEWEGPYIAQQIAVNRYIAELNKVQIVNYNPQQPPPLSSYISSPLTPSSIPPPSISAIVTGNNDLLNNIRLWDQEAAELKLKPELGQKNDINFVDKNIVRFNNTMYWAAPTAPNLPQDVTPDDTWYNEHFVYTHSGKGVLMMGANTGNVIDPLKFFKQKNIYYGDSGPTGIFNQAWSAFPLARTSSDEIEGAFYTGTGGANLAPPLSWVFEPKFMLSHTDSVMHVMRYKDIFDRMGVMFPYFVYDFTQGTSQTDLNIKNVGVLPVTDGRNTYWLMPLIVFLDTSHVPWSSGDMLRLVGFALIDAYNGSVKVIKSSTGDNDPFSQIFFEQYTSEGIVLTQTPEWLSKQLVYPEEMFLWKINRFNQYHVTDPKTFIEAQQFYKVPDQSPVNYYITKPPGFDKPQFVGLQSLELSNSPSNSLVGYMIVQNNQENFGKMFFYAVRADSVTKLLDAGTARDALEKDPAYAKEKILLRNPRVGDELLYRIGDQEVYFIPVYTSSTADGVANQLGKIAVVGASMTGTYYIGLGDTPQQAFENYLLRASGLAPVNQTSGAQAANAAATGTTNVTSAPASSRPTTATKEHKQTNASPLLESQRISGLEKIFVDAGLSVLKPTAVFVPLSFKEADVNYIADSQIDIVKAAITKFLKQFSLPSLGGSVASATAGAITTGPRIYEWLIDGNKTVNFGLLKVVNGIVENHYISIHLGSLRR
jgi:uncharacterized membrane protein (UPF0182 family)